MGIDVDRSRAFLASHARILDRHRFDAFLTDNPSARQSVLDALEGYRNSDGGYGWGLEPDLRAPESQPAAALHALEAIADAGPVTCPHTPAFLDWLASVTLPDGGLPFVLPLADTSACSPAWTQANSAESSLQITAAVLGQAYRAARFDESITDHPWIATATQYCFEQIRGISQTPSAYTLSFALQLLDAATEYRPVAHELLADVVRFVPGDGRIRVAGGAEGETLHLLDYSPEPNRPLRSYLDDEAVSADLERLEGEQLSDGGWTVDFHSFSPAAHLEWRGYATVAAVKVLRAHGR